MRGNPRRTWRQRRRQCASAGLNLAFTRVTAPLAGRVSRAIVTGNLVTNGQTLLTTVVSLDPSCVEFNADEQAYLTFCRSSPVTMGTTCPPTPAPVPARPDTGQRGVCRSGRQERLPPFGPPGLHGQLSRPKPASSTPERCSRTRTATSCPACSPRQADRQRPLPGRVDQRQRRRHRSDASATYSCRHRQQSGVSPGQAGPLVDGLRVVRSGLKPGDTIVVNGLMRVRPGTQVSPQLIAMGERRNGAKRHRWWRRTQLMTRTPPTAGPSQGRIGETLTILHQPPDLRGRPLGAHLPRRADRAIPAADQRVSGGRAAHRGRARNLSRARTRRSIAETVAAPLEQAINGVEDMLYMSSPVDQRRRR